MASSVDSDATIREDNTFVDSDSSETPIADPRVTTDSMISVALSEPDSDGSTNETEQHNNPWGSTEEQQKLSRPESVHIEPHAWTVEEEEEALDHVPEPRFRPGRASLQEPDMAALLARLEMENNAIAKDPKAGIAAIGGHTGPCSQFEYRVRDTVSSSLSMIRIPEEALGMSLGDFWTLVTKDYNEALQLLPTMTPLMIHKGVPPFLRSVVWVGMAGARDAALQAEFDSLVQRLVHERPQNESIIEKDIARCFPAHDMFKDAEGDGQAMLSTVLKAYSLYDDEIGYCQGMGFVVGILLMNMPAKEAFCVFVRMMENHGLRTSYSPSLSGLHSRTYQLKKLLASLSPDLLVHLGELGVELAYLSQWFMTIFATTCPLSTLFRVYDVIFAEGAEETIMRVALALLVSNEQRLMAMTELEDVLSLLLGRSLWEPYQEDPDLLIDEIARLCHVVTREALDKLHLQFVAQSENDHEDKTVRALGFSSGFTAFTSWWSTSSPNATKSASLSPGGSGSLWPSDAPRRSVSKRSVSTVNSASGDSGADSLHSNPSQASTAVTEPETQNERDSSVTFRSHKTTRTEDRGLHEQVEGLLIALSEVQREAAQTAAHLQQERERKNSMADIVFRLREMVSQKDKVDPVRRDRSRTMPSRFAVDQAQTVLNELNRQSAMINCAARSVTMENTAGATDAELRDSLIRLCALLDGNASPQVEWTETPCSEGAPFFEAEGAALSRPENNRLLAAKRRDSGRSGSGRSRREGLLSRQESFRSKRNLDVYQGSVATTPNVSQMGFASPRSDDSPDLWPEACMFDDMADGEAAGSEPQFSKRTSSLAAHDVLATEANETLPEEALLMELVNAKTREATAIHERDEMKVALDRMRRQQEAQKEREAEWATKLEDMERLMAAQMHAHHADMERLRNSKATIIRSAPKVERVEKKVEKEVSLWPQPAPAPVPAPAAVPASPSDQGSLNPPKTNNGGGGWGWFTKGRSVSTGNAGL